MASNDRSGIYHHYYHREMTTLGPLDILFMILDVRYYRTRWNVLGTEQWQWIEQRMLNIRNRHTIKPHWMIFVIGGAFLVDTQHQHWDIGSQRRLKSLIKSSGMPPERVLFLSGGCGYSIIHNGNLLDDDGTCDPRILRALYGSHYEFTVSSFTHSLSPLQKRCVVRSRFAVTPVTCVNGYGLLELDQNRWKFCLKDSKHRKYMDRERTVPSFVMV